MNKAVFGKTMENLRKPRDIKFVTTKGRNNYLVCEPNYHTIKKFSYNLLAIEMRRTQILMNKSVFLVLSVKEISKVVFYEYWYDYVKPEKNKIMLHGCT